MSLLRASVACATLIAVTTGLPQGRDLATVGGLRTGLGITFTTIQSGTQSRITQRGVRILETEGLLQRAWAQVTGDSPQSAPIRSIDWKTEKAVLIHLGSRPTGGYSIAVRRIERADAWNGKIIAEETTPGPGEVTTQAQTSPWVLIKVNRTAADLSLSVTPRVRSRYSGGIEVIPGPGWRDDRPWWEIDGGSQCRIPDPGWWILDNLDDYRRYWTRSTGAAAATAPLENVDFRRHVLVAIHLGSRPSAGYSVSVRDISIGRDGVATIRVVERTPRPGQMAASVMTSPWTLVRLDRSVRDVVVRFDER